MQCSKCKHKDAIVSLKHMGELCKPCYCQTIEKRVRKDLRVKHPLKRSQKVLLLSDGCKEAAMSRHILEGLARDIVFTLEERPLSLPGDVSGFDHVFYPFDADDRAAAFLKGIFTKDVPSEAKTLLGSVLDEEVRAYCAARELDYEQSEEDQFKASLKELEKNYPGSTFGLVKSKEQLE